MKRRIRILVSLIIAAVILAVPAKAAEPAFEYKIVMEDTKGNEVTSLKEIEAGEAVKIKVLLDRTDITEDYEAYGIEMTLVTRGMSYNGDGASFDSAVSVSSSIQAIAGTETVSFRYMDLTGEGMKVPNKVEAGSCSFKVTSPESAEIKLSVGLVYLVGSNTGIIPTEGKQVEECVHEKTENKYEDNKDGTHTVKTVCTKCGENIASSKEKCAYKATVTKEAGCEEKGIKTYECTKCGHKYTEEIPAKGHTETEDKAVEAGCVSAGKTAGSHCSRCGKVLKKQENIPAKGHKWDEGKVTKEPTETETGIKTYTCTVCGERKTEVIPAKPGADDEKPGAKPAEKPNQGDADSKTDPKTGDTNTMYVCVTIAAISLVGIAVVVFLKKKLRKPSFDK